MIKVNTALQTKETDIRDYSERESETKSLLLDNQDVQNELTDELKSNAKIHTFEHDQYVAVTVLHSST